jgi:putative peptidoglycan lipid II flippase
MRQILVRLLSGAFVRRLGVVSGLTLVSRLSGFVRDIALAAVLGNGVVADVFFVALRLPNHFRSIFAEGAFNAAFVPTYTATLTTEGEEAGRRYAGRVLTALLVVQLVVLVTAELFMAPFVDLMAPNYGTGTEYGPLAVTLTRITFPFLACVTLVTLVSGVLNAHQRFAAAAFAPVLFNLGTIAGLALTPLFPTASHAAAIGVTLSGFAQIGLIWWVAARAGILPRFEAFRLDPPVRTFLRRLGPALIGSGTAQIAIFADTILAASLPTGALSALYYADRLYQLPIGVLAVAIGTVLLPELSARYAKGDLVGARRARRRAILLGFAVTVPFVIAFAAFAEPIIRLVFGHGAFRVEEAGRAGLTLAAYALGLPAVVALRPLVAGFQAQGDTRTPMYVAIVVVAANVVAKIILTGFIDVGGLALGTSLAAWANFATLWLILEKREARRS